MLTLSICIRPLSAKIGLFLSPLSPSDAMRQIVDWTTAADATTIGSTARHGDILDGLLARLGTGRNLVNAAHLAALAVEHRASIVSYDNDFGRFDSIRWGTPEALLT